MRLFQLELDWLRTRSDATGTIEIDGRVLPIDYRRNALARRYRLFVDREGRPRVTIPRRGSQREAERFVREHRGWLLKQLERAAARRAASSGWRPGTEILFRGHPTPLELDSQAGVLRLRLAAEELSAPPGSDQAGFDLRPHVERHLRLLAQRELPPRVLELAAQHTSPVRRVTVRNQRSRWGSCSRRGTISLNWRLVQTPIEVRDYIVVHELMHLREMNHSACFWKLVAEAFPRFRASEAWLRQHGRALL